MRLVQNKVLSLLGLATRARKSVSGEFSVEKAVKEGKAQLVIVAGDASDNTKKQFRNMCAYYRVPIYFLCSKAEIGHAMGLEMRAGGSYRASGFSAQADTVSRSAAKSHRRAGSPSTPP